MKATVVVTAASGATGTSNWVQLDRFVSDFETSIVVTVTGTGATYSVEQTLNDVAKGSAATAITVVTAKTTAEVITLTDPTEAVRLKVFAVATAQAVGTMKIIQNEKA